MITILRNRKYARKKNPFLILVITTKHLPRRFTNKQTIKKKYIKRCNSFVRRTLSFHHVPLLISHPPFRSISPPPHHQYVVCRPSARMGEGGGRDARTISSKCRCFLVSVLLLAQLCCRLLFFTAIFFFWFFLFLCFFMHIFVLPKFLNLGECSCCLHILTSYILKNFFFSYFFFSFFVQPVMKIMSSQHSE